MKVYANKINYSFEVKAGVTYKVSVVGKWKDANIECDEFGWNGSRFGWLAWVYDNPIADSAKTVPGHNYMRLMGSVRGRFYDLAGKNEITFEDSGTLALFANDNKFLYFNNIGYLEVELTEK